MAGEVGGLAHGCAGSALNLLAQHAMYKVGWAQFRLGSVQGLQSTGRAQPEASRRAFGGGVGWLLQYRAMQKVGACECV